MLEISIGGGAFTDIITAGGSFVTGGYTGTISTGFSNPLAGRPAWGDTSAGFITTTVNLPAAAAGQNVVLRWRMGSDTSRCGFGLEDRQRRGLPARGLSSWFTKSDAYSYCHIHANSNSNRYSYAPLRRRLRPQQRSRLLQQRLLQREPRLRRQHACRA